MERVKSLEVKNKEIIAKYIKKYPPGTYFEHTKEPGGAFRIIGFFESKKSGNVFAKVEVKSVDKDGKIISKKSNWNLEKFEENLQKYKISGEKLSPNENIDAKQGELMESFLNREYETPKQGELMESFLDREYGIVGNKDESNKNEASEHEPTWEEFQGKFEGHADFFSRSASYYNKNGDSISFYRYKGGKVAIYDSLLGRKVREVDIDGFEELLKSYGPKEKSLSEKNQDEINKTWAGEEDRWQKETDEYAKEEEGKKSFSEKNQEKINKDWKDEEERWQKEADENEERTRSRSGASMLSNEELENEWKEKSERKNNPEVAPDKKDAEIDNLKLEVEKNRREYLEMDYKKRKMWHRVSRFFGDKIRRSGREKVSMKAGENGGEIVDDQDVAYLRAIYENSVLNLQEALLKKEKEKGATAEGLAEVVAYIQKETTVSLADTHDQIKFEHHEGKWTGFIGERLKKASEWYRKQPLKYKLAVGVGLGLAGGGAGFLGMATVASAITAVAFGKRVAMGAISGTSLALTLEKMAKNTREKKVGKEGEKIKKQVDVLGMNEAEKMAYIKSQLEGKVFDVDKRISGIKNKNLRILTYSVLAGSFISTGAMSIVMEKTGVSEYLSSARKSIKEFISYHYNLAPIGGLHVEHQVPASSGVNSDVHGGNSTKPVEKWDGWDKEAKFKALKEKHFRDLDEYHKSSGTSKIEKTGGGYDKEKHLKAVEKAYETNPKAQNVAGAGNLQNHAEIKVAPKAMPKTGGIYQNTEVLGNESAAGSGVVQETFKGSSIEISRRGDSVWKMINRQLEARYGTKFSALDPARKTFIIDYFKDKAEENPEILGLKGVSEMKVGQKVDFKHLFSNGTRTEILFDDAKNLKPEQLEDIAKNNKAILGWVKNHPGESLTTEKTEKILKRTRVVPGRAAIHEPKGGTHEHLANRPGARPKPEDVAKKLARGGSAHESAAHVRTGARTPHRLATYESSEHKTHAAGSGSHEHRPVNRPGARPNPQEVAERLRTGKGHGTSVHEKPETTHRGPNTERVRENIEKSRTGTKGSHKGAVERPGASRTDSTQGVEAVPKKAPLKIVPKEEPSGGRVHHRIETDEIKREKTFRDLEKAYREKPPKVPKSIENDDLRHNLGSRKAPKVVYEANNGRANVLNEKIIELDRKHGFIPGENKEVRVMKIAKEISGNDRNLWQEMKTWRSSEVAVDDMLVPEARKGVPLLRMIKDLENVYGPGVRMKEGETVMQWTARITKLTFESQKDAA